MNAITQPTLEVTHGEAPKAAFGLDPLMPPAQALYDPAKEHDSCGVGFVADMKNRKSHDILEKGLQILVNLDHRGAVGADPSSRRRLRRADPNPACVLRPRMRQARLRPASAGPLCDRPVLHAARRRGAPSGSRDRRGGRCGGRPQRARLARRARRQFRPWRTREGGRAGDAADLYRARRRPRQRRRFRASPFHCAKGCLQPRLRHRQPGDLAILPGLDVGPHHRLQGHGAGPAARALLPRPHGPAL